MFPIALDLAQVCIFLIGEGEAFVKRQQQLGEYGATHVYACTQDKWLNAEASHHWDESQLVMVVGLGRELSETIVAQARHQKKLVNVEDVTDLCDFYFTSIVRRGDLMIAVSTGGASPTLAKKVRDTISERFGPEWVERVEVIANLRQSLKKSGAGMKEIMQKTERFLEEKGWFE